MERIARSSLLVFLLVACRDESTIAHHEHALAAMVDLRSCEPVALLASSTVTNTGESEVNGDVDVSPGTEIIGFPPGVLIGGGVFHSADATAATAQDDLTTIYNDASGQACDTNLTDQDLGGMTLQPGVYCFDTSAGLTGDLTFDGMGDNASVWIIQMGSTLTTAAGSSVVMIGNGMPGRVFWQVGSSATMGTGTDMQGNILAQASITLTTNATLQGRALARTGAVTIDDMAGGIVPSEVPDPPLPDAGVDAGLDGGLDAGLDSGPAIDGGVGVDAGLDAGLDSGVDSDAGRDGAPDDGDSGTVDRGALSGGACQCDQAVGSGNTGDWIGLILSILLVLILVLLRPKKSFVVMMLLTPSLAFGQSVTLDQFHPPETSLDGIEVSRPVSLDHHRLSVTSTFAYSHDPLVYERIPGDSSSEGEHIVRNALALHIGGAYGVVDRLTIFGGLSANLAQSGERRAGFPGADGAGLGDVLLGARLQLIDVGEMPHGNLALQAGLVIPARNGNWTGEDGYMLAPEALWELGTRAFRVTINAGARFRPEQRFASLTVGHEATLGLGVGIPWGRRWEIDVEMYGATVLSDFLAEKTTPLEAIAGLRWRGNSGMTAAFAAGPGLVRGYGSPDFRAVLTVGYATPAALAPTLPFPCAECPPLPSVDWDSDGTIDSMDSCPRVPGPAENRGCPRLIRVIPDEVAPQEIVILRRIEFDTSQQHILPAGVEILEEVRALLWANRQITRVAIEGHADERDTAENNQALSERRANAVKLWLIEHGIEADRLETRGFGESEPFAAGTSPDSQQTNRNVQFWILQPPASVPAR